MENKRAKKGICVPHSGRQFGPNWVTLLREELNKNPPKISLRKLEESCGSAMAMKTKRWQIIPLLWPLWVELVRAPSVFFVRLLTGWKINKVECSTFLHSTRRGQGGRNNSPSRHRRRPLQAAIILSLFTAVSRKKGGRVVTAHQTDIVSVASCGCSMKSYTYYHEVKRYSIQTKRRDKVSYKG